jgi:hypothetical protein
MLVNQYVICDARLARKMIKEKQETKLEEGGKGDERFYGEMGQALFGGYFRGGRGV